LGGGGGGRIVGDWGKTEEMRKPNTLHIITSWRFYTPPIFAGQIFVSTVCEEVIRDVKGEEDEGRVKEEELIGKNE
jgi:hypothetical protein